MHTIRQIEDYIQKGLEVPCKTNRGPRTLLGKSQWIPSLYKVFWKSIEINDLALMILTVFKMFPNALLSRVYKGSLWPEQCLELAFNTQGLRGRFVASSEYTQKGYNVEHHKCINYTLILTNYLPQVPSVRWQWCFLKCTVSFATGVTWFWKDQAELSGHWGYQSSVSMLWSCTWGCGWSGVGKILDWHLSAKRVLLMDLNKVKQSFAS